MRSIGAAEGEGCTGHGPCMMWWQASITIRAWFMMWWQASITIRAWFDPHPLIDEDKDEIFLDKPAAKVGPWLVWHAWMPCVLCLDCALDALCCVVYLSGKDNFAKGVRGSCRSMGQGGS